MDILTPSVFVRLRMLQGLAHYLSSFAISLDDSRFISGTGGGDEDGAGDVDFFLNEPDLFEDRLDLTDGVL